jgi:hypothetical protein
MIMNTRFGELYRRIGAGMGWLGRETVNMPVKVPRQRSDEEIQAALKAVERLKVHARDMRKSGVSGTDFTGWINEGRP